LPVGFAPGFGSIGGFEEKLSSRNGRVLLDMSARVAVLRSSDRLPESLGIDQDPVKQVTSLTALQNRKEGKPPRVATVQVDLVLHHREVAFFEIGNESLQGVADTLGGGDSSGHREKPDEAWSELGGIAFGGGEVVLTPSIVKEFTSAGSE